MIGGKLFDYEITRKIKAGGMGIVYEARRSWGKREKVAVKFLLEQLRDDERIRRRFIREAEILEMLSHPRIVRILNLDPERDAFVMEFVEGKTLSDQLKTNPLAYRKPEEAARFFAPLLDAFDYAHHVTIDLGGRIERGVIHRDIKPSNIIVEPDGQPKILDFGISRVSSFESTLTDPNMQMGSVAYMSPEQIVNPASVDWRSDIYSLGVNLWEMFVGKSPYPQVTSFEVAKRVHESICKEPLVPLEKAIGSEISPDELPFLRRIDAIIAKATAKDPAGRYQRCGEMSEALLAAVGMAPVAAVTQNPTSTVDEAITPVPVVPVEEAASVAKPTTETPAQVVKSTIKTEEPLPEIKPIETVRPAIAEDKTKIQPQKPTAKTTLKNTPAPAITPLPPSVPVGNGLHAGEKPSVLPPKPPIQPAEPVGERPVVPSKPTSAQPSWLRYAVIGGVALLVVLAGLYFVNKNSAGGGGSSDSTETTRNEAAIDTSLAAYSYADSCYEVGENYYYGKGLVQNFPEAANWYLKAAEAGQPSAQNSIGYMYLKGSGVKQNYAAALLWLTKSAAQGNAEGQSNLAFMYQDGLGVPKNLPKAVDLYRKAAEAGKAEAQNSLGYLYDSGLGVIEDNAQAVVWYQKAANQGNSAGQFNLGTMYEYGEGVPKSISDAKQWYKASAKQGNKDAQATLTKMGETW
jgi:TPR repeat protein/serine/threonine protein kinase